MRIIKKLNLFILKSFVPLFAMTFFIVLFIILMQFLWRTVNELVGKGIDLSVMAELFFYAGLSFVPMALPLAILLASLMTFGNLGEKSELTAIKASGIPLIKVMQPLIVLMIFIAVGGFFFQNNVLPKAQVKMWTLLFSVRQKSPEVEIPEGVFYDQIPGYNLFVKSKNRETGVLYDAMIYDIGRGGDNATILLADSARLAFTNDMRFLYLHLFTGEEFENLREQRQLDQNVPFRRETFYDKEILIPFDANFNRMDEEGMRKQFVGKNISELRQSIDSISTRIDSVGKEFAYEFKASGFPVLLGPRYFDLSKDIARRKRSAVIGASDFRGTGMYSDPEANFEDNGEEGTVVTNATPSPLNLDSLINSLTPSEQSDLYANTRQLNKSKNMDLEYRALVINEEKMSIRRHDIELIKKFTLSVACIIFFFIGAPLGAIIRKGGLGMPLVISVLLFVVYYLLDNFGVKMAKEGKAEVWLGMWLSSFILMPLGIFVTYKAMNDSAVFNKDTYLNKIRKLLGLSETRHMPLKEVILNEISSREASVMLARIYAKSSWWLTHHKYPENYFRYWFGNNNEARDFIVDLGDELDSVAAYLSDSRDLKLLKTVEDLPVLKYLWIYSPIPSNLKWLKKTVAYCFPIGVVFYLISLPYKKILYTQLKRTKEDSLKAISMVDKYISK